MTLRIEEDRHVRDVNVIRLAGDVDAGAVRELHRRLGALDRRRAIVVDLSEIEFIEPSMLGWLVTAVIRLRPRAGRLVVLCPDPAKRQVFELVGLDRVFPVAETLDDALHELGRVGDAKDG